MLKHQEDDGLAAPPSAHGPAQEINGIDVMSVLVCKFLSLKFEVFWPDG